MRITIRKGTAKLTGNLHPVMVPRDSQVRVLNGPPVKTINHLEYRKMLLGEWSPW